MPTPQPQHEAELLASQLEVEALARTSLNAASSLRSLHDRSKVNYLCPPTKPKADGSALRYIERMEQGVIECPCSPMDTRRHRRLTQA